MLAHKGQNWLLYDEKFRKLRSKKRISWSRLHVQTHLFQSLSRIQFGLFTDSKPLNPIARVLIPILPIMHQSKGKFFEGASVGIISDMGDAYGPVVLDGINTPCVTGSTQVPCVVDHPNKAVQVSSPTLCSPEISKFRQTQAAAPLILPTPVKVDVLHAYLKGYDAHPRKYIFEQGFSFGMVGKIPPSV